ncbi:MAG TPA: hypothetical protein VGW36_07005, partial [Pyrinomonadaceae bacterium]|nr:hypothetical protein [Pyrinomonadaceae bacterium]
MPEGVSFQTLKAEADTINEAFGREFKRFDRFVGDRQDGNFVSELLKKLVDENYSPINARGDLHELEELRVRYMGKKSAWSAAKKKIGNVADNEQRSWAGQHLLLIEVGITDRLETARLNLERILGGLQIESERIDVTLPGRRPRRGHLHPITILRERIEDIFVALGYAIEDGREIETDFYNFDALNIPANHPARASQDTFYTTDGFALRSQTSTVQIHAMQRRGAPLRMIAPGRVFRRDTPDPTHNPMFYQVEGLCVDR